MSEKKYVYLKDDPKFIENDRRFNKALLELGYFGALGFVVGTGACIFFKNKARIRNFGMGVGLGFAFNRNFKGLIAAAWEDCECTKKWNC